MYESNYPLSLKSILLHNEKQDFSIDINKGTLNFILGPENSGKSRLIKKIVGIENSVSGQILYYGQNIQTIKKQNLMLYFPSTSILFEDRKVIDNIVIICELSNISLKHIERRIKKISPIYGLDTIKNIKISKLPKSIKSILILSLIEIILPEIVVIGTQDFHGDQLKEDYFYKRLFQLKNQGFTIVISTQRFSYIDYADNIILLVDSKPLFVGNPRDIMNIDNPKEIELMLLKKIEESYERIKIN